MSRPSAIVIQDQQIARIMADGQAAPSALFEAYRISGENRDAFVAALIARLCVDQARATLGIPTPPTEAEAA